MLSSYIPILFLMFLAIATAVVILGISAWAGHKNPDPIKLSPYECGVSHLDAVRKPTTVRFYLIAMMFIVFDVEAAFLYPWATVMDEIVPRWTSFIEMLVFLGVLMLGYLYILKKGALEWD